MTTPSIKVAPEAAVKPADKGESLFKRHVASFFQSWSAVVGLFVS